MEKGRVYELDGYKISVNYLGKTTFEKFVKESVESSFVPKILKELESYKIFSEKRSED